MESSGISSSYNPTASQNGLSLGNPAFSLSQVKSSMNSQLVAQLPAPASSAGSGIGSNLDIYDIVSKQSLGLLISGGRTSMQIANVSLGIDMSQRATYDKTGQTSSSTADAPGSTATDQSEPKTKILDDILKSEGYVKSAENPYVVTRDFFTA